MTYLPQFKIWLETKGYSASTSRNYLADLGKYLEYVNHLPQSVSMDVTQNSVVHILSAEIIKLYVSYLSDKTNNSRYLASLRQFCQFALDQKLISSNPFKGLNKTPHSPDLTDLVKTYELHLLHHQTPPSTIRNYINDLSQYISWLNLNPNPSLSLDRARVSNNLTLKNIFSFPLFSKREHKGDLNTNSIHES